MSTVSALYRRLVDDAAMFPPGDLPLTAAVPAHHDHHSAPYAELVGAFVCTDEELPKVAETTAAPLRVAVVITGGAGGIEPAVRWAERSPALELAAVEVRLRDEGDLARNALRVVRAAEDCLDDQAVYVETGLDGAWEQALDAVAEAGYAAKLRTGGLDAHLFPTPNQVAAFITACLDREVPFKCTAGLHNAVRHTDPATGFEHHGFLNVLLATRASLDGAAHSELVDLLTLQDGAQLADRARALTDQQAEGTRRWFTSFGSCSIDEPRHDLAALNLMENL
ncbi:hypothetical protein [Kribbella sandramycini]|uniref:Uncharacterized protein n=1 Tax=Kribbella sandramycini TaxID=60450 RepID=A0A841SCN2_9ACTN|nr:hypothetical protein [Kribbella sandramycini]MBB6567410.1 hypothetical protein [Kribbella sandramycini]